MSPYDLLCPFLLKNQRIIILYRFYNKKELMMFQLKITKMKMFSTITLITAFILSPAHGKEMKAHYIKVEGTAIHYFDNVILHNTLFTEVGKITKSTETIDLNGDIIGRILYHPTSTYDFNKGTLVNSGIQVFSGTILDSEPTMIVDNRFRFEVNLSTGETYGKVFLTRRIAGSMVKCELEVTGTGLDERGNALAQYTGHCKFPQNEKS